jgi:hypothetical protein
MSAVRLFLAIVGLGVGPGCPRGGAGVGVGMQAREDVRQSVKEHALVSEAARLYWEGVRWDDSEKAVVFVESAESKLLFRRWLGDLQDKERLVDAMVLQVDLADENLEAPDGHIRTAVVHVRVEGYQIPAQVLRNVDLDQQWYRNDKGWWVEWSPEDVGAMAPMASE